MGKIRLVILCLILTQNLCSQDKYILIVKYNDSIIDMCDDIEIRGYSRDNSPVFKVNGGLRVNLNLLDRDDIINLNKDEWRMYENYMVKSFQNFAYEECVGSDFKLEYKISNNKTLLLYVQKYELDFKNKKIIFKNNL